MESRNYNPEAKRTKYKILSWQTTDTLAMSVSIIVCVSVVIMSFM